MRIDVSDGETFAKRLLYLAWKSAEVVGMGIFQDKGSQISEDEIWKIGGGNGKVRADYLNGRMMKLYFDYDKTSITLSDHEPRSDYQSWCLKYPTMQDLVDATTASLQRKEVLL